MLPHAALDRVVVAISTFRSDAPVMALLGKIFAGEEHRFAAVVVVDSCSDGRLAADIARAGWPVRYENSPVNLGAAGNLARRLTLAAEQDADWCFAINHDGTFDPALIVKLVERAAALPKVGAVYARRVLIDRGGSSFKPIISFFGTARHAGPDETERQDVEVAWDSSNGALYGLTPVRQGVPVWTDLWHGWEDFAYGWQLRHDGWKQYRIAGADFLDDYEYQRVRLLGRQFHIARKPPWYAYYLIRNLVLIVKRTAGGMNGWLFVANRLAREIAFTLLFRSDKILRLKILTMGLRDGLADRTGKGPVP